MADTDKFWTAKEVSVCLRIPQLTISEAPRREVLARLLQLNHERYEEEVRQGLHEEKKGKKGKPGMKKTKNIKNKNSIKEKPGQFTLFEE